MFEFSTILNEIGNLSLDAIWFPLLVWSICALCVYILLKIFDNSDVLYQYHTRVALIAGIPLGILASVTATYIADLVSTSSSSSQLSFIIIQNPIAVTVQPDAAAVNWSDPYLWLGLLTVSLAAVACAKMALLFLNYLRVLKYAGRLTVTKLDACEMLSPQTNNLYGALGSKTYVTFSGETEIPFTFGWRKPVIVIPSTLRHDPDKVDLAVRHELMHIKRSDYLVNGLIMAVKSLFWFHPLLHLFHREIQEYREISCDSEVLADETVSRKKYAQLLFELSQKHEFAGKPVVSMSVNKSTLKKRINTMKTLTPKRPTTKSILVSIILLTGISGFIACSDLQNTGITNEDLEETQFELSKRSGDDQPLFVLDGILMNKEANEKILRIKPEYIRSITVLKDEEAINKYGQQGKNGVIMMDLVVDKGVAFSDLKPDVIKPDQRSGPPAEPFFVVVEEMPKLIDGLQSIQEKIQYPEMARKAGIEGRVIVQFIVTEQGQVENPQIIRGIGGGCDEEALRVVKQAKFEPGTQRGEPVRVQYSLPIEYKLGGSEDQSSNNMQEYEHSPDTSHLIFENINNTESGTLSGTFINQGSKNHLPIPYAEIILSGTSIRTTTDSEGNFRLEDLPSGEQELDIYHDGVKLLTMNVNIK